MDMQSLESLIALGDVLLFAVTGWIFYEGMEENIFTLGPTKSLCLHFNHGCFHSSRNLTVPDYSIELPTTGSQAPRSDTFTFKADMPNLQWCLLGLAVVYLFDIPNGLYLCTITVGVIIYTSLGLGEEHWTFWMSLKKGIEDKY